MITGMSNSLPRAAWANIEFLKCVASQLSSVSILAARGLKACVVDILSNERRQPNLQVDDEQDLFRISNDGFEK